MCAFKYRKIIFFCEIKINHKDIHMWMHSYWSIVFNMLSGFDLNSKGSKNHLEMELENLYGKRKGFLFPPLPFFNSACWPFLSPPAWLGLLAQLFPGPLASSHFSSWAEPAQAQPLPCLPLCLSTADSPGLPASAFLHLLRVP